MAVLALQAIPVLKLLGGELWSRLKKKEEKLEEEDVTIKTSLDNLSKEMRLGFDSLKSIVSEQRVDIREAMVRIEKLETAEEKIRDELLALRKELLER